jgi:hypothetical protein
MWGSILLINSVLWALASTFFIFSIGASILWWTAKPVEIGFILGLILTGTEVLFGFFAE